MDHAYALCVSLLTAVKAPGLVRYFDKETDEASQAKPSIFKCKHCGAEGDHKTYECPVLIVSFPL